MKVANPNPSPTSSPIVSELFVDPDGLLNRSREIRQRLLREGCSDVS